MSTKGEGSVSCLGQLIFMASEQCPSCPYILWSLTGRVLYVGHAPALAKAENYNDAEGAKIAILQTRSFIFAYRLSLTRNALG